MTHRFFVEGPIVEGAELALPADVARQVTRVLRLRAGDSVTLLDGSGRAFPLELTGSGAGEARGIVGKGEPVATEPAVAITLCAAPLKGDHYAYTLQKATEIGVAAFVPIVTERTVAGEASATKLERWRRIVREAAEQAGRGRLPTVAQPRPLAAAIDALMPDDFALIPWEEAREPGLAAALAARVAAGGPVGRLTLFIGPEGGFAAGEIAQARAAGVAAVTMGPRILRADTAAAVALTLALATLGEMG